ncbi:MAG: alpha/beta fold hydrolase [Rhizobiaceae bacterium]
MIETLELPAASGTRLKLRKHIAASARAVVQINHDLAEHAGRYDEFARYLCRHGFHVYAHDHRGHGGSLEPDRPRGDLPGPAILDADLFDLHELIAGEHPGVPVIVFGQGAGALIAAHFLFDRFPRLAGAALWNMPIAKDYAARFLGATLIWERFRLGSDVPSPTMTRIIKGWDRKAGGDGTGFDWLSEDPAVVEAYIADTHCRQDPTIGAWINVSRMMSRAGSKRAWAGLPRELPLHIAAGGTDPVTDHGRMVAHLERQLETSGFAHVTASVYADQRHDLVNNGMRDVIWRDFVEWLEGLVGPTASP